MADNTMEDLIAGKKAKLKKSLSSCSTWKEVKMTEDKKKITKDLPEYKKMGLPSRFSISLPS